MMPSAKTKTKTMRLKTGTGVDLNTRAPHHSVIPNGIINMSARVIDVESTTPEMVKTMVLTAATSALNTTTPAR
jgi:hypothetical protein